MKWNAALLTVILLLAVGCQPETIEVTRVVMVETEGEVVEITRVVTGTEIVTESVTETEIVAEQIVVVEQGEPAQFFAEEIGANVFQESSENLFVATAVDNLSTFAVDVDSGSYTVMRDFVERNQLPPADSVRIEEYINYFDPRYALPGDGSFAIHLEGAAAPYGEVASDYLVRVGIQGYEVASEDRPDALLIFVIDVSGSMSDANRLPLVKQSLTYLVANLRDRDRIGIVTYGNSAQEVLRPTRVGERGTILQAINALAIEGSTNLEAGLELGYEMADSYAVDGAINRLVLLSDGVANVGNTVAEDILQHAEEGISLSTFGFGMNSYNDHLMEQLADKGDGSYAYIDTIDEAVRVFDTQLTSTLLTIAKDAKVQVEFNPDVVERYRLLGYENRAVADADFTNDEVDAGEIGAGHDVTALYEIGLMPDADADAIALVAHVRYLDPVTGEAMAIQASVSVAEFAASFVEASPSFQLTAVVAEFAEVVRGSIWSRESDLAALASDILRVGSYHADDDDVVEFVRLALAAIDMLQ